MGAIADAFVAYGKPLIDQTDGSPEELDKALQMTQLCYNLALLPEESRDKVLGEFRSTVNMDDEEFDAFRRSFIAPMIQRHQEMFPRLHRRTGSDFLESGIAPQAQRGMAASAEKYPGTDRYAPSPQANPKTAASAKKPPAIDRYAPCPCNSGEKYKFCCGKKGR
jgi:hypothetical protein